tara:strand:- start:97 stop:1779 length:1683 start_codon:yes stop_codon:yes gene_type:complete
MDDSGKEHDVVHTNHSGAIIALETKLGTGDSNAVADAVLMGTGSGTSGWDTSPTFKGAVTVGVDDTGHDVIFYGATAGDKWKWDESSDAMLVEGHSFLEKKVQTGATSFTQEPWSNSTIALGDYGSIGTQGSYRTALSWNFERGTDSAYHHLDVNSYPQAGLIEIGASGINLCWEADYENNHTDAPTTVLIMDADAIYPADDNVTDLGTSAKKFAIGYINYVLATDGSVSYPAYAFASDTDSGIYLTSEDNAGGSTVPVVAIATGGTVRATFGDDIADFKNAKITTTDIIDANELRADDGGATDPSFTFSSDGDTGWYRYGANSLARSVGGNEVWYVSDAGNNVFKTHTNATAYNYFLAGGGANSIIYMGDTGSNTTMGGIYVTGSGYLYTRAGGNWRTRQSSGEFRPYTDSAMTLGSSAARWTQLYADTSTISTSDVNLKTDIIDTPLGLDFIKSLRPVQYKWKKTDGGKDGVRDHQGLIAQEVKVILDAQSGTNASEQAMWCDFAVDGEEEELPSQDDPEVMVTMPAPTDQALRYEELIAPIVKAIQELEARVASLES